MSDQDKKRWQQHIPHVVGGEKCQAWVRTVWREIESRDNESRAKDLMQLLQEFPEIEAELLQCKDAYDRYRQGERYGARLIWIAKGTEIKDIQAQRVAYVYKIPLVLTSRPERGCTVTSLALPEFVTEGDTPSLMRI